MKQFQVDTDGTLTTGLLSYFEFEGDSTDFYGSDNGTDTNISYSTANGKVNEGAAFNGTSSHITHANGFMNFDYTDTFSVSYWAKWTGTGYQEIWCNFDSGLSYRGFQIENEGSGDAGKVNWILRNTNVSNQITVTSGALGLNDGNWHHFVWTYDGSSNASGVSLYVDGSSETLTVNSDNLSATSKNSKDGAFGYAAYASANYFNGSLDEFGVWSKVLSSQEISDLYNGGSGQTMVIGGTTYTRAASLSMMNDASRYATAQRVWQTARTATVTMMNAAARYASVVFHLPVHFARSASVTMMNASSRYATAVAHVTVVWVRTASVTMMNAASRLASATKSFIIKISSTIRWNFFDWD